jgi:hypothetical protein
MGEVIISAKVMMMMKNRYFQLVRQCGDLFGLQGRLFSCLCGRPFCEFLRHNGATA